MEYADSFGFPTKHYANRRKKNARIHSNSYTAFYQLRKEKKKCAWIHSNSNTGSDDLQNKRARIHAFGLARTPTVPNLSRMRRARTSSSCRVLLNKVVSESPWHARRPFPAHVVARKSLSETKNRAFRPTIRTPLRAQLEGE